MKPSEARTTASTEHSAGSGRQQVVDGEARHVIITGASSGIGAALARCYARGGSVLGLLGRDAARLERVAQACRAEGAEVRSGVVDARDRTALGAWLREFDRAAPVDLVIANAGVHTGTTPEGAIEDPDSGYELLQTNVLGVMNTVQPLLPAMLARGRGRIAIMGSIAGFIALPDAPAYCASKAAVLSYGLSLRAHLYGAGIRVTVICPGFITSPMSSRIGGWRPLEMPVEAAAERMVRKLRGNHAVVTFPWPLALAARLTALLPDRLRRPAMTPFRFRLTRTR